MADLSAVQSFAGFRIMVDQLDDPVTDDDVHAARASAKG